MTTKKNNQTIVAIGGGHGLGRMLSALSEYGENVTGIVTTTDNGGSTGRIRACQGGIAWGDTRNCINQLITEPSIGSMIFEYRFKGNGELDGHNLGNLMLTALDNLSIRPLEAINLIRDMLKVTTNIVPMSEHPADLAAQTRAGIVISGETDVDDLPEPPARLMLDPVVPATKEAVLAINDADLVILGPGSFLTSIMPPILLPEISRALKQTQANIMFVRNLGKETGPAGSMSLKTMLSWCERSMGGRAIDIVLGPDLDEELEDSYQQVVEDLASANHQWRHDRDKLTLSIKKILSAS
ncbi:uridine diphosphate-N-acetylglucosamine-binding protein YvcK [Enterovibrio makurazakiensis]|uniref:uridine diphosphate-N-acetylglucosamine-binding protein YvcK n=1 Tax=Enterovibrio makurazakiensis TaxID=2910232 RepID=UPI003D205153